MTYISGREIRRIKYRNEPYYIYYSPGTSFRAHDHNYVLRLLSDKLARQSPEEFCLLPQFRTMGTAYPESRLSHAKNRDRSWQRDVKGQSGSTGKTKPIRHRYELDQDR